MTAIETARVVIADDAPEARILLRATLEGTSWLEVVGEAGDGRAVVELATRTRPDLVVLDCVMPGISGLEAMAEIRRRCPGVKIVVLSSYSAEQLDAVAGDADAWLTKGASPQTLISVITEMLNATPGGEQSSLADSTLERSWAAEALEETRSTFRATFDAAAIPMALVTPEGRLLVANPAYTAWLDRPIDGTSSWFELFNRSVWGRVAGGAGRVLNGELTVFELLHANGTEPHARWGELSLTAVRNARGEATCLFAQINDVTGRVRAERRLSELATIDPLTELPNRIVLTERLGRALIRLERHAGYLAVLFCDLDRFKVVNDTLGHAAGDELLQTVARLLSDVVRPSDTVVRFGGDEFVVLCEDLAGPEDAGRIAQRVVDSLCTIAPLAGRLAPVGVSVGVATARGAVDPDVLLRQADTALARAKLDGRGRYRIYEPAMGELASAWMEMETELREGMAGSEFRLLFQPVVNLRSGLTEGIEALLRWRHPRRGELAPETFMSVAEGTGLAADLDRWALDSALSSLVADGDRLGAVPLAINASSCSLARPGWAEEVAAALYRHRFPSHRLCIEITEAGFVDTDPRALRNLADLRDIGVALAVDDFGTGQSSLSRLQQLRIDTIKLDPAFVLRLDDRRGRAVARAVVDLGLALDLQVVAKGVDRRGEARALRGLRCRLGQGGALAPPVPLAGVTRHSPVH